MNFRSIVSIEDLLPKTKVSSILDYQQDTLCPEIWIDGKLKPEVKKFIYDSLKTFFQVSSLQGYQHWLREVLIGSSLATYFYRPTTDLDIKCVIDLELFVIDNPSFRNIEKSEIIAYLVDLGRSSYWLTASVPGTLHQLDVYFYDLADLTTLNLLKYDSLYQLSDDTWIKEPKKLPESIPPDYVLQLAKEKAAPYLESVIMDIEKAKQDTIDFILLRDFLKNLDSNDLEEIYEEFSHQLDIINSDLEKLVKDKDFIKNLRSKEFSKQELDSSLEKFTGSLNFSDGNLIFKVLQRYGYLRILSEIKHFLKHHDVEQKDAERILKILHGA